MRALQFHGREDIRVDDVPEPVCEPGFVKIQNAWCGICGSGRCFIRRIVGTLVDKGDLHEYLIGPFTVPTSPHPLTGKVAPCILGHEFSGKVVEVGEGVTDLEIGQHVVAEPILVDGTCHSCSKGLPRLCTKLAWIGYSGTGGGFADYVCVDRKTVHAIPNSIPLDVAALVEPLSVAWHAVKVSKIKPGESALVLGAGPIGLAVLLCLQAHGVKTVLMSELSPPRASRAQLLGVTRVFDPSKEDVVALSRQICGGEGPHVAIECAGVEKSLHTAINAVRPEGTIVNVALFEKSPTINPNVILKKELTYRGALIYSYDDFEEVISAISSGKIQQPERLITARVQLENVVDGGFKQLIKEKQHVKILVTPQEIKV